jgi:hypothetical protein
MAGEPCPVGGRLAFLDPLLCGASLVVETDDGLVRPGQRGDDEAHAGEKFAEVVLHLRDYAARAVPGGCLVVEAPVADQGRVTWSVPRSSQQILDLPL